MTRERAAQICQSIKFMVDKDYYSEEVEEALNMAIKTLQHEQERREDIYKCPNCTGEVHKNYIYCPFCGIKVGE